MKPLALLLLTLTLHAQNWPPFRGPSASGVADRQSLPSTWNARPGANIRWKIPIPGLAHSSPIVWGERVFLTTAISSRGRTGITSPKPIESMKIVTRMNAIECERPSCGRELSEAVIAAGYRPGAASPSRARQTASSFPPISFALEAAGRDLVHRDGIVEPAAEHDAVDLVAVADVLRRIGVEDDEVGELARLE